MKSYKLKLKSFFIFFLILLQIFLSIAPSIQTPFSPKEALANSNSCSASGSGAAGGGGTSSAKILSRPSARVGGVALDQAAAFLANMDDISGAYYDANLDRIVFVGKTNTTLPEFDKDDLAVAIKAVIFNKTVPAVSMEFRQPDDGKLDVLYYGGIENTKFGKVLYDADYKLKLYIHGYDDNNNRISSSVPGYKPVMERFLDKTTTANGSLYSRWWITPKEITLKKDDTSNSFVFNSSVMQVRSEQMSPSNDPRWNQAADEFAQHHTQYYDQFAQETPFYADAKQLGKIVAVIKWINDSGISTDFNWAQDYAPKIVTTPKELPVKVTQKVYNGFNYTITGGVSYNTANTYNADNGSSAALKNSSQAVPTTKEDIHWTFIKDGQTYESVAVAADAFRTLGSYNTSVSDMSFPTTGDLNLAFQRSYSSYSGGQNGIGRGWSILPARLSDNQPHSPAIFATCPTNGVTHLWKMALDTGEGGRETFTFTSCQEGYKADDLSYHTKLTAKDDNTEFTATLKNQTQYIFDQSLRLKQVKDKNGNTISYNYNSEGKLISVVDSKGHQITVNYSIVNGQKLISSIQDWSGRTVNYSYDDQGNLLTVKDPKGNATTYTYNSNFKLTGITDREGKTSISNTYTPEAKIATQQNSTGVTNTYNHDDTNKVLTITDNNARSEKTKYDIKGRILEQTDPLAKAVKYTYDKELTPLTVTDKNNNVTTYTYDTSGNVASVKYPNNKTVDLKYDDKNRLTEVTDNRYGFPPKVTAYTYDTKGNLTKSLEESVIEKKYTYSPEGETLTYADPNNHLTKWTRDSFGNKLTETLFYDARTANYTYDTIGRLTKQTDAEGKITSYTLDANDNVLTTTDGAGTTTNVYDKENRLTRATAPNNAITNFTYNTAGSLSTVIDPLNNTTSYSYDGYQNLTSKQDALNRQTQYAFDKLNRRTQATTPLGNIKNWEYDANGNITKRVDEANNIVTYQYDNLNRLTKITYPDFKTVTMSYDDRSNLTQMTDQTGITSYTYDRFDRLTQVQSSSGLIKYEYDLTGKLTKITYPDNKTVSYGYDSDNTLLRITDWNNQNTDFPRYNNGLPQMKLLPNGINATYSYDSANRLNSIEYIKGTQTVAKFIYERNSVGQITKATEEGSFFTSAAPTPTPTSPPGTTPTPTPTPTRTPGQTNGPDLIITNISTTPANPSTYSMFDIAVTIKNQGTTAVSDQTLVIGSYHDLTQLPTYTTPTNNQAVQSVTLLPGESKIYNMQTNYFSTSGSHKIHAMVDQQKHLLESNEDNNAFGPHNMTVASAGLFQNIFARLGLLNIGILTISTVHAQTPPTQYVTTFNYDTLGRLLKGTYPESKLYEYTYDSVGNRLTSKVNTSLSSYTYNNDNQLTINGSTAYTHDKRGNQTAAGQKTFAYNFENKLTQYAEPGTSTQYTYDGANNRLSQNVNNTTTQFVNDVSGDLTKVLVAKNISNGTNNFFVQGPETISEGDSSVASRKYYLYDGLGNIRFTTDSSGNKLQAFTYDPYGTPTTPNTGASFKYKGEQADQGGMYFMRARYYDPSTGRFISKDPVEGIMGNPQSQNGYNYANDDPINLNDPSGEQAALAVPVVAACVVGAAAVATNPSVRNAVGGVISGAVGAVTTFLEKAQVNPKQDTKLSDGEIKQLKKAGYDIHGEKGKGSSKYDLYKDDKGNIIQKPKGGQGEGEPLDINVRDL